MPQLSLRVAFHSMMPLRKDQTFCHSCGAYFFVSKVARLVLWVILKRHSYSCHFMRKTWNVCGLIHKEKLVRCTDTERVSLVLNLPHFCYKWYNAPSINQNLVFLRSSHIKRLRLINRNNSCNVVCCFIQH